ncbi:hypothetical protein NX059_007271 [Plenodomus lindquistii]|nr:hypothetical protein NX059_007271 [Plenodomus lindquistii]
MKPKALGVACTLHRLARACRHGHGADRYAWEQRDDAFCAIGWFQSQPLDLFLTQLSIIVNLHLQLSKHSIDRRRAPSPHNPTNTMAAINMSLVARSEQALHQFVKRDNWAQREPGVIVVLVIVFLVSILVIAMFINKRRQAAKAGVIVSE